MISVRSFSANRGIRAIATVLLMGGAFAFLLRLSLQAHHGHGLDPYVTRWGIETTPVQTIIGLGVSTLVIGAAALARRWRGSSTLDGRRRRRAKGKRSAP